jgi:hypothetical protein
MDQPVSSDEDFFAWSEQQAAALRASPARREEPYPADPGSFDQGRVRVRPRPTWHWRKEVVAFHSAVLDGFSLSMAQRLESRPLWQRAIMEAALEAEGGVLAPGLPRDCPFVLDVLVSETFDFCRALETLRAHIGNSGPAHS